MVFWFAWAFSDEVNAESSNSGNEKNPAYVHRDRFKRPLRLHCLRAS
jgi:hypothetical protein